MSYSLNISQSYAYVANLEIVTLLNQAGATVCTVQGAKRLMQSLAERAPSDAHYLYLPIDFRLPGQNVTQAVQPGWMIKDANNIVYVIQEVDPPGTYAGTYNCYCLSLMVMGEQITWNLPTDSTDADSSPITTQPTSLGPFAAAIKEIDRHTIEFQGIVQGTLTSYLIWFVGDVTLIEGALGTDGNGNVYTVTGVRNRNRIDELIEVECEIRPG